MHLEGSELSTQVTEPKARSTWSHLHRDPQFENLRVNVFKTLFSPLPLPLLLGPFRHLRLELSQTELIFQCVQKDVESLWLGVRMEWQIAFRAIERSSDRVRLRFRCNERWEAGGGFGQG